MAKKNRPSGMKHLPSVYDKEFRKHYSSSLMDKASPSDRAILSAALDSLYDYEAAYKDAVRSKLDIRDAKSWDLDNSFRALHADDRAAANSLLKTRESTLQRRIKQVIKIAKKYGS